MNSSSTSLCNALALPGSIAARLPCLAFTLLIPSYACFVCLICSGGMITAPCNMARLGFGLGSHLRFQAVAVPLPHNIDMACLPSPDDRAAWHDESSIQYAVCCSSRGMLFDIRVKQLNHSPSLIRIMLVKQRCTVPC
jgi:hypothetical protein